ncbi:MAG: hypothetical protein DRO23_07815 [Thermoprotei archaeon]|nr:MAG: hypothetical protein DRO23_07815 [Thermoprotei archaeon]
MKPSLPFNIPLIYINPEEKIAEIYVECSPECLGEVFRVLSKYEIKLGNISRTTDKICLTLFITKFKDKKKVEKELLKLDCVKTTIVFSDVLMEKGLGVDVFHYPIMIVDSHALIFNARFLIETYIGLRERLGASADVIFYHFGFHYGYYAAKELSERFNIKPGMLYDVKEIGEMFSRIARISGWGFFEIDYINVIEERMGIRFFDSWTARIYKELKGQSKEPVCHMVRGMIAGVATAITGKQYRATEVLCAAKGDPFCYFEVFRE